MSRVPSANKIISSNKRQTKVNRPYIQHGMSVHTRQYSKDYPERQSSINFRKPGFFNQKKHKVRTFIDVKNKIWPSFQSKHGIKSNVIRQMANQSFTGLKGSDEIKQKKYQKREQEQKSNEEQQIREQIFFEQEEQLEKQELQRIIPSQKEEDFEKIIHENVISDFERFRNFINQMIQEQVLCEDWLIVFNKKITEEVSECYQKIMMKAYKQVLTNLEGRQMVLEKNVRNLENLDDEGIKGLKLDNISETQHGDIKKSQLENDIITQRQNIDKLKEKIKHIRSRMIS